MYKYVVSLEPAQLPVLIRSAVQFECRSCAGSNVLCTASTRPATDFGRIIVHQAVRADPATLCYIAPWLSNDDFAWACRHWPLTFAPRANVGAVAVRHIYTARQACNIIAGGSAACVLVALRPSPQHALYGSAVRAWNIWRKTGVLLPPWKRMIRSALVQCVPVPFELIAKIIYLLTLSAEDTP